MNHTLLVNDMHILEATILAILATSAGVASQACTESRGPLAGAHALLSVASGDASGLDPEETLLKPPGFSSAQPGSWSSAFPGRPDFRKSRILYDPARLLCQQPSGTLDIDAMSVGLDRILGNQNGVVGSTGPRWGFLSFSVARGTAGASTPEGKTIVAEAASPGGASGDLFTFILPGSSIPLPPHLVATTMRGQDSTEMGLPGSVGSSSDIDAVDHSAAAFRLDPLVQGFLPNTPEFYFSVSNATVGNVPLPWWNGTVPSGASVFRTIWNAGRWTCPQIVWTYSDFDLDSTDDLVALAVDSQNQRLLFSSTDTTQNPLMFWYYGNDGGTPTTYSTDDDGETEPVSDKIGIQSTEVINAVCSLDPSLLDAGSCAPSLHAMMFGTPLQPEFPGFVPYTVNGSGFRWVTGASPVFMLYMIGWPPNGMNGNALLYHLPTGIGTAFPRTFSSFCGSPESWVLGLPSTAIGNACVPFSWFAQGGPPFILPNLAAAYSVRLVVP